MRIETDVKLDFKDVLIRPKRSTLNTRSAVDVDRAFRFLHTGSEWKGFPLIAANMDVTGTMAMAHTLGKHGALTALHKHYPEPKLIEFFASSDGRHAFYSLGTTPGDVKKLASVAKAYGAGADFVMLGGMLAGHDECDGQIRFEERGGEKIAVGMTFYGMSSETAMRKHSGGVAHYRAAEGKTVETPYRGSVEGTMAEIMGGVRSMMTYIGATQLKEVPKRTTFVRVTAQTNDVFGG